MCVTLWKEHDVFFNKDACISVIGCMYIHMDIYISTLMMMISWGTFFSEVLSSCFFWKGNNTFDGKIIVTWLKIARLCGCLAYQGHNIYDVRSQPPLVYMSEMIFFLKRKKKVMTSLDQVVFPGLASFQARGNGWFIFMSDADVPSCLI